MDWIKWFVYFIQTYNGDYLPAKYLVFITKIQNVRIFKSRNYINGGSFNIKLFIYEIMGNQKLLGF